MEVLLVALTGLALLLLLLVIGVSLYLVQSSLHHTNATIAKISWGVRAIEKETDLLSSQAPPLIQAFAELDAGAKVIGERLASAERRLGAAGESLTKGGG